MRSIARLETTEEQKNVTASAKYSNILQGRATNALSKTSKKSMNYDDKVGNSWSNQDGVLIKLNDSTNLNLNVQAHKVLDALILKLTCNFTLGKKATAEVINKSRAVTLSLTEYMELCGLRDKKEARKQLTEAVRAIYNISMGWQETIYEGKKKIERRWQARVADVMGEEWVESPIKNSKVLFKFTFDMAEYLSMAYIMPYPENLFQINSKYNPHSYYLGRRLLDHYNQNINKENRNRILVKTLLRGIPDLPRYEEVRRVKELIIDPFERDLDALVDIYGILCSWEYCSKGGTPVPEEQLVGIDYNTWASLLVLFKPKDYPEQRERLSQKTPSPPASPKSKKTKTEKTSG